MSDHPSLSPANEQPYWPGKQVCLTGGGGFLGQHVLEKLRARRAVDPLIPRSAAYDLTDPNAVHRLFTDWLGSPGKGHPEAILIHLAALAGGIGANRARPADFFYQNLIMGVQLMHAAWQWGVGKFAAIGTVCAYPKYTPIPFQEEHLWDGYPEETNAPYGLAKKMLLVQAQAYRDQYGFNAIYLLPVNLYGPGDNFDLESSHVIPALIRKCEDARRTGQKQIVLWGDGSPTREFLYAGDAAEGILAAAERYNGREPVNLGAGQEISIKELAELIARLTGFHGAIAWDTSQPNGQLRRALDTSRAAAAFGFHASTPFEEGLRETISWYRNQAPSRD